MSSSGRHRNFVKLSDAWMNGVAFGSIVVVPPLNSTVMQTENYADLARREFLLGLTVSSTTANDVDAVIATIHANRGDSAMFLRGYLDVRQHLSDFIVAKQPAGRVLGCAAVHAYSPTLAEILSVSVLPRFQGRRVGQLLMEHALDKARAQGFKRVWLATSKPEYFARFGFQTISRWDLRIRALG